jgi:hypothetical protein
MLKAYVIRIIVWFLGMVVIVLPIWLTRKRMPD